MGLTRCQFKKRREGNFNLEVTSPFYSNTIFNIAKILQTLKEYTPISLEETSGIKLMNRTDTKYVTSYQILREILLAVGHDYRVQEVNGEYNTVYHTICLDTADRDMYLTHRNGRVVWEKTRIRTHVDSDLTFSEVEDKSNKGGTDEKRIRIGSIDTIKEDGGEAFLCRHAWYEQSQLLSLLGNSLRRITLVNKHKTKRLTTDAGVTSCCLQSGKISSLDNTVITELKQDGYNSLPIKEMLRKLHIQSFGFSKYCIESVLAVSHLECDRLKPKLRVLNKMGVY